MTDKLNERIQELERLLEESDINLNKKSIDYRELSNKLSDTKERLQKQIDILSSDYSVQIEHSKKLNDHLNRQIKHRQDIINSISYKLGFILTRIPRVLLFPVSFILGRFKSKSQDTGEKFQHIPKENGTTPNKINVPEQNDLTISVITPSYNQAEYLQDAIDSVAKQSFRAIEHLILDPGSTDGSLDIAKKAPTVTLFNEPMMVRAMQYTKELTWQKVI